MVIEPKIIKTDEQYGGYLAEVERLATADPAPGTPDGDRLELLAKLVEDYEKERFKFERPDPVDAILFRMEQQGLRQKDLVPILGGKNRVSEILSRKRPLTLSMMRALSDTLHIPADLLIREPDATYGERETVDVSLSLLVKSGWFTFAKRFLAEKGIALVVLPALPKTKLDGAAMRGDDGAPIIGLTIRNDRLDSFWFTLLHELVHAWKHLPDPKTAITDESVEDENDDDAKEVEANRIAKDAFIPRSLWKRSEAFLRPSTESIRMLADKLSISPAVIAGRLRREKVGYGALSGLIGQRQVRKLFPDVTWN